MMPGGGAATTETKWRHTSFPQMDLECQDLQEYCRLLEKEVEGAREEARAFAVQNDDLQDALQAAHSELEQERVQVSARTGNAIATGVAPSARACESAEDNLSRCLYCASVPPTCPLTHADPWAELEAGGIDEAAPHAISTARYDKWAGLSSRVCMDGCAVTSRPVCEQLPRASGVWHGCALRLQSWTKASQKCRQRCRAHRKTNDVTHAMQSCL